MTMTKIPFIKMDGLGNDFVIIDNRSGNVGLTRTDRRRARAATDRGARRAC